MAYTSPNLTPSGTSFAQFQAGGVSGHLERLIAAQAATVAPTAAPTATATGGGSTGGALAAGTYYLVFTETNGIGETTVSPESTQLSVAAGNQPLVTFPTLKTGNTARNLYITAPGGASGTEVLYATGITAGTYNLAAAGPTNSYAVNPPTANTTGLSYNTSAGLTMNTPLQLLRAAKNGNLEDAFRFLRQVVADFNHGEPTALVGTLTKLRHAHTVFAMLATLCA